MQYLRRSWLCTATGWPAASTLPSVLSVFVLLVFVSNGRLGYAEEPPAATETTTAASVETTAPLSDDSRPPAVCYGPGTSQDYVKQVTQHATDQTTSSLAVQPKEKRQ